jgi:hypothetical protein
VWFIGGARIFAEAMPYCDVLDVTYIPETVEAPNAVKFPTIDATMWRAGDLEEVPGDARLKHRIYERNGR